MGISVKRMLFNSALLFSLLGCASLAAAAQNVLWTVGKFDHSSGEFRSQDIDYASPKSDPVFVVGQSRESKDWLRFQPGPANGIAGGRLHPFTIKFQLQNSPRGVYHLKLAVLYETPRLSFLKVRINGHSGVFYFHPKLDFHAGDWEGTFVPQTSEDNKVIAIPAAWLRKGENELVLTALDDPAEVQNSLGAIAPGHSGIVYDALEFSESPDAKYDRAAFTAQVVPTIFYRNTKHSLSEVVEVFTNSAYLPRTGKVSLSIDGHSIIQKFTSDSEFGEKRFEFVVPEWQGVKTASVRFDGSGKQHQLQTAVKPAKKWNIAIIPHEHLDIGFTDYPAKVAELHSQSVDAAMDVMDKIPEFRWTLDGSWVAEQYLAGRSSAARDRFLQHVRSGTVVIPPEYANQHTGNASWEGLARSLYDSNHLALQYGLPQTDAAQDVDVPSYTWAYASILHDAGVKYFVGASNSWRAPIMLIGRWNEKSPFYWEGPDGGRVLMWYSRAYLQMHTLFGSPWRMESVRDALPVFLQAYTRPDYTASTVIVFGSQLENTPLATEQADLSAKWNAQYAWPHLQFATVHSAMQQIEHEWKGAIPVHRGDFGPYWEDGYGSDAAYTAIHRENQHRILTAEIMGSSASSLDPKVRPNQFDLNDAWRNELLYDEHTWTFVGATTQPENHQSEDQLALKESRVVRASNDIDESIQREWAQLEAMIAPRRNSVAVFNSLSWRRSGMVETDLPVGSILQDAASGEQVPFEVIRKGKGIPLPGFGPGSERVRFEATDVPAVGYKLYTVTAGTESEAGSGGGNVLENKFYRITLDGKTGAVSSIFDKQLGVDLVDQSSPYKFGSYLYVTGGDNIPDNSLYRYGAGLEPPVLTIHPEQSGKLLGIRKVPYGIVATVESRSLNTPSIRTEITLYNSEKKIEFSYRLHKDRVLTRESAYIAFPFAVRNPQFEYGSQTGWIDPAKNELPGGSREWYLATNWAGVHDDELAAAVVPLDAPLVTFGDIVRGRWPSQFTPASSTVFSWLMNNYWNTNFPAWQGGDFTFRYVVTSSATMNEPQLTRFALNALTPLERDDLPASQGDSILPVTSASLLEMSSPSATLLTWKRAEDGQGNILRIQETAGESTSVKIHSDFINFQQAWLCSLLEENRSKIATDNGDIELMLKPFQVVTIRTQSVPRETRGNTK